MSKNPIREPAAGASVAVTQQVADELARRGGPVRQRAAAALRELGAVDRAVYSAVAATPTPSLDEPLRRLSNAANNSVLWLAIAVGLGVAGGSAGRRAAGRGTVAIRVASPPVEPAAEAARARPPPRPGCSRPRLTASPRGGFHACPARRARAEHAGHALNTPGRR